MPRWFSAVVVTAKVFCWNCSAVFNTRLAMCFALTFVFLQLRRKLRSETSWCKIVEIVWRSRAKDFYRGRRTLAEKACSM